MMGRKARSPCINESAPKQENSERKKDGTEIWKYRYSAAQTKYRPSSHIKKKHQVIHTHTKLKNIVSLEYARSSFIASLTTTTTTTKYFRDYTPLHLTRQV